MYTHTTAVSTATITTSNGTVSGSTGATTAFKIKGYTATRTLGRLVPVKSDRFTADEHTWRIFFFPGIVSFQVRFICGNNKLPARAIAHITLLPRDDGGELLSFTCTFQPYWGERMHSIAREELDKYVADDDSLTVQCDVSVVETSVVKVRRDKRKEVHGQASSFSGSPARLSSRIKTAWLGFTRGLLHVARPLLA
jgi:hypothetical protein